MAKVACAIQDNDEFSFNRSGEKDSEMKRAVDVKNQIIFCDKLLESRIKYNKILVSDKIETNTLNEQGSKELGNLTSNIQKLLDRLIEVQNQLFQSNDTLKSISTISLGHDSNCLAARFDKFKPYRNKVLSKWEDRVKLFSRNSQSLNTEADILTKINAFSNKHIGQNNRSNAFLKTDQEFYATLIQEFIERKGKHLNLGTQIKKQTVKKLVDTKSSKGRKMRYVSLFYKFI